MALLHIAQECEGPIGTELTIIAYPCDKAPAHQETGKERQKQAEASDICSSVRPCLFQSDSGFLHVVRQNDHYCFLFYKKEGRGKTHLGVCLE